MILEIPLREVRKGDRIGTARGWAEILNTPVQNKHNQKVAGEPFFGFTVRHEDGTVSQVTGAPSVEVEVVREEVSKEAP